MTPAEKKSLVRALEPIWSRVRTDISAIKYDDGSRWTTQPLSVAAKEAHVNGGPARGACPIKEGESVTMLGVLDMDSHKGETSWEAMLEAATDLRDGMAMWGLNAIPFRSSGGRGIHLIVMWDTPQDAYSVRQALTAAIGMCGYENGAKGVSRGQIEVFPKQDEVGIGENGNQFILPLAGLSVPLDLDLGIPLDRTAVIGMQWPMSDPVPSLERPQRSQQVQEGAESITKVREALFAIPNDERIDYDAWFKLGCAVHEATGGVEDGFDLFEEWSAQSLVHDPKFARDRVWEYLKDAGKRSAAITRASLFKQAGEHGWGKSIISADGFDEVDTVNVLAPAEGTDVRTQDDQDFLPATQTEPHERPVYERDAKTNDILPTIGNLLKACRDPLECRWRIAHDRFKDEIMVARAGSEGWRAFGDADYTRLSEYLEREFQPIGKERLRDAVHLVAHENSFDSAIKWLDSLAGSLTPRVDLFLTTYFGVEDSPYARAVSRYMWTAMAGRVLDPGCQADMAPVFISEQGTGKTTAIKALAPSMDFYVEVGFDEKEDNLARKMRGRLVGEIAELTGFRRKEIEAIKAFMTRTHENWVPKFKEFGATFPRRLLFFGTTNNERFLVDQTGNRRWLPVRVGVTDIAALKRDVEALWAEARDLYRAVGIQWAEAQRLAREIHAEHEEEDPWVERIQNWLKERDAEGNVVGACSNLTTGRVLTEGLRIDISRASKSDQMRAASILKKMGWLHKKIRVNGEPMWVFVPTMFPPEKGEVGTETPF